MLIPAGVCLALAVACGGAPSGSAPAATATSSGGRLVSAEVVARCAGFGSAEAAALLGVPAASITDESADVTPTARGCTFSTRDDATKVIAFTLERDESVEAAARAYASMKSAIPIAAGAQQSSAESALIEIGGLGDEALWTNTNRALTVRQANLTILVMQPSDRKAQVAVADKVLALLKGS